VATAAPALDIDKLKEDVIKRIGTSSERPSEVLKALTTSYPAAEVQTVLAELLDTGEIELTNKRVLRIP